jgi:hypothetical protein
MATQLFGIATPFGPLTMDLKVAADGKSARLHVEPMADASCAKIVVHAGTWTNSKKDTLLELDPKLRHDSVIPLE